MESKQKDPLKKLEEELIAKSDALVSQNNPTEVVQLIRSLKNSQWTESKAKMTRLLRHLLDALSSMPNTLDIQKAVVNELIDWTAKENRIYLKYYLETRLASIYYDMGAYQDALALVATLMKELKRLDDKVMLLEVQLLESKVHYALKNVPKAKASLTTARTFANAIYCPPLTQASLDMQSGILHAEEHDYKTAFSYFYETFEGIAPLGNGSAMLALKYMLLCKIMMTAPEDVFSLINTKSVVSYKGKDVEAMVAVAKAYQNRSLKEFEQALVCYDDELGKDNIIRAHLKNLYESLLEKNLIKLIEPYSRVELDHLALLIQLPRQIVENKLGVMILDKVFAGMIDQGSNCLIVLDDPAVDKTYQNTIAAIKQMDHLVDSLCEKASVLAR